MAWKNGGGTTYEIAVFPPEAGFEAFDWRVSLAVVDAGGPFSTFPGVDRILTVLDGSMALATPGREAVGLSSQSGPFAFPGDLHVDADIMAGPIRDLNVMTRRGLYRASVRQARDDATIDIAPSSTAIILASSGSVDLIFDGQSCALEAEDAMRIDAESGGQANIRPHPGATALVVQIVKRGISTNSQGQRSDR